MSMNGAALPPFNKLPSNRWFAFLPRLENYSARTGHNVAVLDNNIYLFGGVDSEGHVTNDFVYFNLIK